MTVVEGQTGSMIAGQELPITSARFSTNTVITEKTTYRPVGVQLHVTPETIGGLRMVRQISRERKIPGLGDIKFLGWLFKSHRSQRKMTDLFFYITPSIIPRTEPI